MALFRNWVQLTPEEEKVQREEKLATQSFAPWITEGRSTTTITNAQANRAADSLGWFLDTLAEPPKPTVATWDSPIVNRGVQATEANATSGTDTSWQSDLRVTKIWEVLSGEEKRSLVDKARDDIRNREGISFEERNRLFQELQSGVQSGEFFGWETQLERQRLLGEDQKRKLQEQTGEALTEADRIFRADLERETTRIKEQGQAVMDTTQRLNSLRGGGRSSANEADIQKQQWSINELIGAAQAKSDLALQKRRMEIEGASAEAFDSINQAIRSNEELLNARIEEATKAQALIDGALWADFAASSESLIWLLSASGIDVWDYDEKASQALGYISDSKGVPLKLDKNGNPVKPLNQFGMDAKISNFKDANDNTYVYTNGELTSIIQRDGSILTGDEVNTVNVPAQVEEDKTIKQRRDSETSLRNEFIKRPEVKRFQEIRAQFERVKQGADANNASGDIALVFSFMKMLDPGSVVRESEFATAQNAAGVPDQLRNTYNKVLSGTRLGSEQRVEFKNTAENLLKSEVENFEAVKDWFTNIITDAGARPEFVIIGDEFDSSLEQPSFELDDEGTTQLDDIFWASNSWTSSSFTSSSWKEFNINFNTGDKTSSQNDPLSFIKAKEGFRSEAYLDSAWVPTIGYGATRVNGKPVKMWDTITKQQGEEIFNADIARHSNFKNQIKVPLSKEQESALASFEFNLWPNIWKTTWKSIIDDINSWNIDRAVSTLLAHNKARDPETKKLKVIRGLTNRRREEAELLKMNS